MCRHESVFLRDCSPSIPLTALHMVMQLHPLQLRKLMRKATSLSRVDYALLLNYFREHACSTLYFYHYHGIKQYSIQKITNVDVACENMNLQIRHSSTVPYIKNAASLAQRDRSCYAHHMHSKLRLIFNVLQSRFL